MASCGRKMLKLLLLGDDKVGKTAILNQFVNSEFTEQYLATIGCDFSSKQLDIDGKCINLQIWDTAGREHFQSYSPFKYCGTDCCILVYDVTNWQSFENIQNWKNDFTSQLGLSESDYFCFLLLGNKIDLPGKAVSETTAREYAKNNGNLLFYEVSSKTGENIHQSFESIIQKALKKQPPRDQTQSENKSREFELLNEKFKAMKNEFEIQLADIRKEIAAKDEQLKNMQIQMEKMKKEYDEEIQHLKEAAHFNTNNKKDHEKK